MRQGLDLRAMSPIRRVIVGVGALSIVVVSGFGAYLILQHADQLERKRQYAVVLPYLQKMVDVADTFKAGTSKVRVSLWDKSNDMSSYTLARDRIVTYNSAYAAISSNTIFKKDKALAAIYQKHIHSIRDYGTSTLDFSESMLKWHEAAVQCDSLKLPSKQSTYESLYAACEKKLQEIPRLPYESADYIYQQGRANYLNFIQYAREYSVALNANNTAMTRASIAKIQQLLGETEKPNPVSQAKIENSENPSDGLYELINYIRAHL